MYFIMYVHVNVNVICILNVYAIYAIYSDVYT